MKKEIKYKLDETDIASYAKRTITLKDGMIISDRTKKQK